MNLHFHERAVADLIDGYFFYERQSPGLGGYFSESLRADIESLHLHGGIHRKIFGYHRMIAGRFPHAIFYQVEGDNVWIWRVLDCRRNPKWIERQVRMRHEGRA